MGYQWRRLTPAEHVQKPPLAAPSCNDLDELEFGDYGRDPRFLPGWWIVPMCFITPLIVGICLIA